MTLPPPGGDCTIEEVKITEPERSHASHQLFNGLTYLSIPLFIFLSPWRSPRAQNSSLLTLEQGCTVHTRRYIHRQQASSLSLCFSLSLSLSLSLPPPPPLHSSQKRTHTLTKRPFKYTLKKKEEKERQLHPRNHADFR